MLTSFFSSIFLYALEKILWKELYKVLEMELKTYIPVSLKFCFEKIRFNVLDYFQNDFIRQRPGLSKDQTSMFKSLVMNSFILKYHHAF